MQDSPYTRAYQQAQESIQGLMEDPSSNDYFTSGVVIGNEGAQNTAQRGAAQAKNLKSAYEETMKGIDLKSMAEEAEANYLSEHPEEAGKLQQMHEGTDAILNYQANIKKNPQLAQQETQRIATSIQPKEGEDPSETWSRLVNTGVMANPFPVGELSPASGYEKYDPRKTNEGYAYMNREKPKSGAFKYIPPKEKQDNRFWTDDNN